jgi:alkylation response protein AidB-like acyl-CoA dehydrogenase
MLTATNLIDEARALAPVLAERAAETEAERRILPETIEDLQRTGIFGVVQPTAFGGAAASFDVFVDVLAELARGCASTAWVCANVCSHNWMLSMFPLEAQEEVWRDDRYAAMSGTLAPTGKVERIDGGYQLSGQWQFASGCHAASWGLFGAVGPHPDAGERPARLVLLVPRSAWEIQDTWYTGGLSGTGSNDITMAGAFVPDHRVMRYDVLNTGTGPGRDLPGAGPLPRLPLIMAWAYAISAVPVGAAQSLVETFVDDLRAKLGAGAMASSGQVGPQLRLAEAAAEVDAARLILRSGTQRLMVIAEEGREVTTEERSYFRRDHAYIAKLSVSAADRMFAAMGAHSLFDTNPAGRRWRDVHAAQAHHALVWDSPAESYARVRLGLEPNAKIF